MIYSENFLEQIKSRLPISTIISKKVTLQRKGNKLFGLCPFHDEKTPSFSVDDAQCLYYCFGCHAGGDIFKFVMENDNMNFIDSVKYLASIAGIDLEQVTTSPAIKNMEYLFHINNIASQYYISQLANKSGQEALNYLYSRNINKDSIKNFHVGFASNNGNLKQYLLSMNINEDTMIEAGLVVRNEAGKTYDRFRNRIIYPIIDTKNRVMAFGARSLGNENPKYLNSPETTIFKKNQTLFAENIAKNFIHKKKRVIVVEGYMDTISMHQNGFNETLATLGTAFTANHLMKLWKLADNPIICMDGDIAGQKAMERISDIAISEISEGKSLKFAILPNGKDPDDILINHGVQFMENIINNAINLSDYIWDNKIRNLDHITPESLAGFEKYILEIVQKIKNVLVRNNYYNYFRKRLWDYKKTLRFIPKTNLCTSHLLLHHTKNNSILERYENNLLAYILYYPSLLENDDIYTHFINIEFNDKKLSILQKHILEFEIPKNNGLSSEFLYNVPPSVEDEQKTLLYNKLKDLGFANEVEYLCGDNSSFIDKIGSFNLETRKERWLFIYGKYHLSLLENEYKKEIKKMTESSIVKANELQKQIAQYKIDLAKYENQIDLQEST